MNKKAKKEYDRLRYLRHKEEILEHSKDYYKNNRERVIARTSNYNKENKSNVLARHLKRNYNISPDEYRSLLASQNNKCAICGRKFVEGDWIANPNVDHSHSSGKVRGLLCRKCNSGLGMFEDNISNLQQAIQYLT